jgi:hypothetical protein
MRTRTVAAIAACLLAAACTQPPPPDQAAQPRVLERAGQPVSPLKTAGHIAAARVSALTGDQAGVQANLDAMTDDLRRGMKLPDPGRPIPPEAARSAVQSIPAVRSVAWLDRSNLMVRVDGAAQRSHAFIDEVCYQLQTLGDTLAVVVHVQNASARTREQMDTLSRNCQLPPGDQALFVRQHQVDVLDPALRDQARADAQRMRQRPARKQDAGDRAALEAIPEM